MNDKNALEKGIDLFYYDLPQSILAFEAAIQNNIQNDFAWTKLGIAQSENWDDIKAIQALKKAVSISPGNLEALMNLAGSQISE